MGRPGIGGSIVLESERGREGGRGVMRKIRLLMRCLYLFVVNFVVKDKTARGTEGKETELAKVGKRDGVKRTR